MRVIAGSARSLALKSVPGKDTRPTTDRIKETLFNMIHPLLQDACFLDLFSGSGGIGIEALSRGASHCYFVDNTPAAVKCIEENLNFTKLKEKGTVLKKDAVLAVKELSAGKNKFDIVFMDPPYQLELEVPLLKALKESKIINENSLIIVEADKKTNFDYLSSIGMKMIKEKTYKTNKHIFIGLV